MPKCKSKDTPARQARFQRAYIKTKAKRVLAKTTRLAAEASTETEKWEGILKSCGLTMDAGRRDFIDYGFTLAELDFDGRHVVKVSPEALEHGEWPLSL